MDISSLIERLDLAASVFAIDQPVWSKESNIMFKAARALEAQAAQIKTLNSGHAEFTFQNGDQLALDRELTHFAGHEPAVLWVLTYGERVEGRYGETEFTPGEHHFMTTNTEYFAQDQGLVAIRAFNQRVRSYSPAASTTWSQPLSELLKTSV